MVRNTLTRKKEELVPIEPNHIRIYACGPTVYNYIHIGNARPICAFDVLRRYLKYRGYQVTYVQNFTDVDDKIIRRANEEGVPASELSERYIREYKTDAHGLNVMDADIHPKVTENMDLIIDMVKKLVESGHAYESNGDVYFRTKSFPEYGKLCHQPMEELQAGARISVGEVKEDPMDFAVWKAAKPGEPAWDTPWGSKGRPGWHIECSAMSEKYLGLPFDIHGGGADLVFPHHENERAQSECACDSTFANYWMHSGMLQIANAETGETEKMSKSLNNFLLLHEVLEQVRPAALRMLMLQSHYRSPLVFGEQRVAEADELARITGAVKTLIPAGAILSIDTTRASVAAAALSEGAQIINDVSGGTLDAELPHVVADHDCLYIVQHWRGWLAGSKGANPDQDTSVYEHGVLTDVHDELMRQVDGVLAAGVKPERIIIDPGLGFSKPGIEHNLPLLTGLETFRATGYPVLIGQSRKRFISAMLTEAGAAGADGPIMAQRDDVTAALSALSAEHGAWAVRVHDVAKSRAAVIAGNTWREYA